MSKIPCEISLFRLLEIHFTCVFIAIIIIINTDWLTRRFCDIPLNSRFADRMIKAHHVAMVTETVLIHYNFPEMNLR